MMHNILNALLKVSIYSSALIVITFFISKVFSSRLSPKITHALWLVVLLRLLLPLNFDIGFNLPLPSLKEEPAPTVKTEEVDTNYIASNDALSYEITDTSSANTIDNPVQTDSSNSYEASIKDPNISLETLALVIWLSGAIVFFIWNAIKILLFGRNLNSTLPRDKYKAELNHAKSMLGIKKDIAIVESKYSDVPFVYGAIKPRIVIPIHYIKHLGQNKISYIIMHELCHVKRRDVLINYIWLFAKAIHWFNPFTYLAHRYYKDSVEECCDETVASYLNDRKKSEYTQSLIDAMRFTKKRNNFPLSASFIGKKSAIRKRVIKMINPQKKSKTMLFITILLAVIMVIGCFTTACQPKENAEDSAEVTSEITEESAGNTSPTQEPINITSDEDLIALPFYKDGETIFKEVNLDELKSSGSEVYFDDKVLHYGCYSILESDNSLIAYSNKMKTTSSAILSEDELLEKVYEYVKKIWNCDVVEYNIIEDSFYKRAYTNAYYFCVEGLMGEQQRPFYMDLNSSGELDTAMSYPQNVDLSKGISIEDAKEAALELLKQNAHITDESKLTLIDETITNSYISPMYVFKYEYRSDTPTPKEFDYNAKVKIVASTGITMGTGLEVITENLDILQPDEAEQMARELIAEEHYGSKDMADRLVTTTAKTGVYWGVTDNIHGPICYFFSFDYIPKEDSDPEELFSYTIEVLSDGFCSDIGYGPTQN